MENGKVEIHDLFSNQNDLKNGTEGDTTSTSDADSMQDTVEFRILMAYAKRRRPTEDTELPKQESPGALIGSGDANGTSSTQTPVEMETESTDNKKKKKKKKTMQIKKKMRGWKSLLCIRPRPDDDDELNQRPKEQNYISDRCGGFKDDEGEEEMEDVAKQLTKIASEIPFTPPDLETDAPDDNVEKLIGLLLRESGDRLHQQVLKDVSITKELFYNYSFFKKLITTLQMRMGLKSSNPDSPGPQASPQAQIAVTCEATSRLSAMDTLPSSRLLGFGARYLSENYSSWVQQQGGYEAAFKSDDEEEDDNDVQ